MAPRAERRRSTTSLQTSSDDVSAVVKYEVYFRYTDDSMRKWKSLAQSALLCGYRALLHSTTDGTPST